mmetsp:Transcript_37299/g.98681  ORF Transcript_37299/g.98681 Transcript_37299/m.98681 type:complete len:209 (+) Transcript_37299:1229-1855(+)
MSVSRFMFTPPSSANTSAPRALRSMLPSGVTMMSPNSAASCAKAAVPGRYASCASASQSTASSVIPSISFAISTSILRAVDLPAAMPPLSPRTYGRCASERRHQCSSSGGPDPSRPTRHQAEPPPREPRRTPSCAFRASVELTLVSSDTSRVAASSATSGMVIMRSGGSTTPPECAPSCRRALHAAPPAADSADTTIACSAASRVAGP